MFTICYHIIKQRKGMEGASWLLAGLGIILTLVILFSGVTNRNTLAFHLWTMTDRTGYGPITVINSLAYEAVEDFHIRLQSLLDSMFKVHHQMHQYPILDLFYRSKDPKLWSRGHD